MREDRSGVGLPPRVFLYTIDQIAVMLGLPEQSIHTRYVFHDGRDIGRRQPGEMLARNIANPDDRPDWRVTDKEFIRWMRSKGFKYYDRGVVTQ